MPAPRGLETNLRGQLDDTGIERAGDLAEGRRAEGQPEAGCTRLQAGQRNSRPHAVGHVERFAADFQAITRLDAKLAGHCGIELPEARPRNVVAARRAQSAGSRGSESCRIDPTAWRRT